jgi:hypothetical protein
VVSAPLALLRRLRSRPNKKHSFQRFITAAMKVHSNTILICKSKYIVEKQHRTQDKVDIQILPRICAFDNKLSKMAGSNHRADSTEVLVIGIVLSMDFATADDTPDPCPRALQNSCKRSHIPSTFNCTKREVTLHIKKCEELRLEPAILVPPTWLNAVKKFSEIFTHKNAEHGSEGAEHAPDMQLSYCNIIVTLLDSYQISDGPCTFYLVMEPWALYTCSKFLHQSDALMLSVAMTLPCFTQCSLRTERQVIRIFCSLGDGLSYLHNRSIKHKDLLLVSQGVDTKYHINVSCMSLYFVLKILSECEGSYLHVCAGE